MGDYWEGEGVEKIQRRCLECDLSPGSSVSKRLWCWRAVQFLLCAHIKAVCILQAFLSEGHRAQLVSRGCNAELWPRSRTSPLPCKAALSLRGAGCCLQLRLQLCPPSPYQAAPGLAGGWGAAGAKGLAVLRWDWQSSCVHRTKLVCLAHLNNPKAELMEQTGVKGEMERGEGFCL